MAEILAVESLCGGWGGVGSNAVLDHSHVRLGCDNNAIIIVFHTSLGMSFSLHNIL